MVNIFTKHEVRYMKKNGPEVKTVFLEDLGGNYIIKKREVLCKGEPGFAIKPDTHYETLTGTPTGHIWKLET